MYILLFYKIFNNIVMKLVWNRRFLGGRAFYLAAVGIFCDISLCSLMAQVN